MRDHSDSRKIPHIIIGTTELQQFVPYDRDLRAKKRSCVDLMNEVKTEDNTEGIKTYQAKRERQENHCEDVKCVSPIIKPV